MSRFLNEVDAFQKHMEQMYSEESSPKEVTVDDYNYQTLYAGGLLKLASFRLPVHLIAQLNELRKFTPYSTKAEMVSVMLQDRIEAFLADSNDSIKQRFETIKQTAVNDVTQGKPLLEFMNSALSDPAMLQKYTSTHADDLKEDVA